MTDLKREIEQWTKRAHDLWQLLDDIDTLGDSMKPPINAYFKKVNEIVRRRASILHSDGQRLFVPPVARRGLEPIAEESKPSPIPLILYCPMCQERHIDEGVHATRPHRTHSCQSCGHTWRPAIVPTVGVKYLPGYKNEQPAEMDDIALGRRLYCYAVDMDGGLDDETAAALGRRARELVGDKPKQDERVFKQFHLIWDKAKQGDFEMADWMAMRRLLAEAFFLGWRHDEPDSKTR